MRRVFVAFDEAASAFARRKVRFTGNPVRRALVERAAAFAGRDATNAKSILILGGSQGSHAVNELASGMVRVLDARGRLPPIVHQTGPDEHERMRVHYAALGYDEDRVQVRAVHRRHAGGAGRRAAGRGPRRRAHAGRAGDHAAPGRS